MNLEEKKHIKFLIIYIFQKTKNGNRLFGNVLIKYFFFKRLSMWHINIHFRFEARPCVYSTKAEIARVFCMCEWVWVMRANVVAGIWSVPCGPWPWSLPARKWSCVLCECARKCVCVCGFVYLQSKCALLPQTYAIFQHQNVYMLRIDK